MKIKPRAVLLAVMGGASLLSSSYARATPIPRLWLQDIQQQAYDRNCPLVGVLRSQSLVSEDERWAVYSRVTYEITPIGLGRLSSVLFVRDLQTQQLQAIYAPASIFRDEKNLGLDFLLLLPLEWRNGRVLVREFSGLFRSQAIRNQAVVWSPAKTNASARLEIQTPAPSFPATVLLGWDPAPDSEQVLFAVSDFSGPPQVIGLNAGEAVPMPYIPPPRLDGHIGQR